MKLNEKSEICLSKKTMLFLVRLVYDMSDYMHVDNYEELVAEIKAGRYSD